MSRSNQHRADAFIAWLVAVMLFAMPLSVLAQTRVRAPSNSYSISDDVKLGQQASAEVRSQLPILRDGEVDNYVESVGRRLVNAIPPEFQQPQFRYSFDVVNARDINAFALPGGPMYVNRGMIEAANSEGEMAGVMAHEISHVALRHGTAQATKAQKLQWGALGGAILGAIIGGGVGEVISQGSQLGLGAYFLKYSRDYERQADILGAQIMARAGYDPRDLAKMFQTIEREGGGRSGPEWLSSHPNPGNRYEAINREAALLRVSPASAIQDTRDFQHIQSRLRSMQPAPSMAEIAQSGQRNPQDTRRYPEDSRIDNRVEYPSTRYRTFTGGNLFRVSVPDNWREFSGGDSVTFAPQGAYGTYQGQSVFTHGAIIGIVQTRNTDLRRASDEYISALLQANPYLRQQSGYQRGGIGGRNALAMVLAGRSSVTGRTERVTVYTTMLRNGGLFYVVTVSPQDEARSYDQAFQTMLRSIQING